MKITPSLTNPSMNLQFGDKQIETRGYLVHENPAEAALSTVKGYTKIVKYTADAINGKGDDYSVGKINDLALRAGGCGIATVLASMTKNPAAKVMEFAGFTSFFAAMSIWPKVFIAAPLKLKTSFDVNQEYVDSYGRRKRFFEDPQYLPWDLWDSKEINKIGDKLKIPQNIENREHHIKAKMQQIATQSNTLWMLTAGLSTPLMASLMGNYVSKYVNNIIETVRTKSAIKSLNLLDFTDKNDKNFKKIFINPIASLFTLGTKKVAQDNPDELLKNLDNAYDSIFGKTDDAEYEFNKARLLYEGVLDDKLLTQYDNSIGATVAKDVNGNVISKIKTRNVDGISLFGNKWKEIPNKLADVMGITPAEYKKLLHSILKPDASGNTQEAFEALADVMIKEFGGLENKEKLQKSLKNMAGILINSIEELDAAGSSFGDKLAEIKSLYQSKAENLNTDIVDVKKIQETLKYIVQVQEIRLENKIINTKSSWFAPVRILDIIAKYSDRPSEEVAQSKELKQALSQFIYGVTPHHINNNFDDVINGDYSDAYRYTLGIDRFFEPLSDKTKDMLKSESKFIEKVDGNTNKLWTKFYDIANVKGQHFESICEWLGKTPYEFIQDAAKQSGIYKGWLKKVGISFAALTGITWFALSQFGKTNKYNPDVYVYKNEKEV